MALLIVVSSPPCCSWWWCPEVGVDRSLSQAVRKRHTKCLAAHDLGLNCERYECRSASTTTAADDDDDADHVRLSWRVV